jgi:hypothetical protein
MPYENRVVLFIDILGFRGIVDSTLDSDGNDIEARINELYEIFNAIRYFLDMDEENSDSETRRVTQFSDSIAISFLATERSEVFQTLYLVQLVVTELILKGVLCRGGVAYGKLIHDDRVLFGPALNTAYDAESKAALFPRIILDESIISLGVRFHATHHLPQHEIDSINMIVSKDMDEMYYIDYFGKTLGNLDDPVYDAPNYIDCLRNIILQHIDTANPGLRVKYGWLKNKFNEMVREIREYRDSEDFIETDSDLEAFYEELDYL